jgi:putative proteasome-type protease
MILGGQVRGEREGICLIYPQGNYIMASVETPYLQIGESKYGKPMLDRVIHGGMSLDEGARLALISLDATIRSNVTVGPPFDLAIYPANAFRLSRHERFEFDSPYYTELRQSWQQGLSDAFDGLPRFHWE